MTYGLPAWAGSADAEALARLLGLGGERDWLDYKRQCDLSSTRDLVEITKDIGAMMITGGYIVVGADDHGRPAGEVEHLELFDPAAVHAKVAKYVPKPFELRVATHACQGQSFALVYVAPHPEGFCVFERDGTYPDQVTGRPHTVFRAGSVFARHGTASEPWNQRDIAIIKQRLAGDADRSRDQAAEALELLKDVPRRLGGSGLWLAVAVVPQYHSAAPAKTSADAAQSFLRDWAFASAPVEPIAGGTATYRQPGGIVITNQAAPADLPHWWRLALGDAGDAVGAHVLAHEVAADPMTSETRWRGLPVNVTNGKTIPVRRDELEFRLETLLDLLTAHALNVGSGGRAYVTALLLTPRRSPQVNVALLNEAVDDSEQPVGWRLACARARQPIDEVVAVPVTAHVQLADMQDGTVRLQAVYSLAADLLALFGIDQPTLLQADGTLDPYPRRAVRSGVAFAFTLPAAEHFADAIGRLGIGDGTHAVAYAQDAPMWATRLWWLLRYFGHDDTSVLDGGLVAWRAAGGPVVPGQSTYPPASFTACPRPELLARLADVREITENGSACLVNALSPEAFRGQGRGAYSRPGRIPGSVNVPWNGLVDPATNRFRPPAELAAALGGGGVRADQPVVAYCGGGISATVDLFALWLTGRDDARLYDGSLTEWSADPDLPLVSG